MMNKNEKKLEWIREMNESGVGPSSSIIGVGCKIHSSAISVNSKNPIDERRCVIEDYNKGKELIGVGMFKYQLKGCTPSF